jgi:Ca-activated chloride channel family protein
MYSFAYPWLFCLLPLPWLVRTLFPPQRVKQVTVRVPFGLRLNEVLGMQQRHGSSPVVGLILVGLTWSTLLTAVARPQKIEPPITKSLPTRDLLLLVDLSGSMSQKDFKNKAGETVDRLTAVKEVLQDFLARRQGDRVGLVVFGDAPYLQIPLTTDLNIAQQLLKECAVGMAGPRTAFGDAIGLGIGLFDHSDAPAKTIVALTDGNDTKSQVPPIEAARVAKQRNIHIYTVAIGDPTTVGEDKLDEQNLRDVAQMAHGEYFFAADRENLAGIYRKLDELETHEVKTVSHRPRHELYYWPLAAALLFSTLGPALAAFRITHTTVPDSSSHTIRVNSLTGQLEVTS